VILAQHEVSRLRPACAVIPTWEDGNGQKEAFKLPSRFNPMTTSC
jgi:hypothetical protein